jgi:hypothetical protein
MSKMIEIKMLRIFVGNKVHILKNYFLENVKKDRKVKQNKKL